MDLTTHLARMSPLHCLFQMPLTDNATHPCAVYPRSLTNTMFILRNLFTSKELDFLCVRETWPSAGESSYYLQIVVISYPNGCLAKVEV